MISRNKNIVGKTRKRAFTLVELLVCVSILIISVSISIPLFNRAYIKVKERDAVWSLVSFLNYARYQALEEGAVLKVCFDKTEKKVFLFKKDDKDYRKCANEFTDNIMFPDSISFDSGEICFLPDGAVEEEGELLIKGISGDFTVVISYMGIRLKNDDA
jgi:Tfp pilus assembly protein FimT